MSSIQVLPSLAAEGFPRNSQVVRTTASPAREAGDSYKPAGPEPTPLTKFLKTLPPPLSGAVAGVGVLSVPLVCGSLLGFPGVAVGAAASFGFQKALGIDSREALNATIWSAILSGLVAGRSGAPSALSLGLMVGAGAAIGALAVMRNQAEQELLKAGVIPPR